MALVKLALSSIPAQSRMFHKILAEHGREAGEAYLKLTNNADILHYFKRARGISKHQPGYLKHSLPELAQKMHTEAGILKSKLNPKHRYTNGHKVSVK